jgi:hypothetical protein
MSARSARAEAAKILCITKVCNLGYYLLVYYITQGCEWSMLSNE